tara:strand:+ start:31951 stop:32220 length:270 start_codon:yes stop_codon:yes gene_type:complete
MPRYIYKCFECEAEISLYHSMSETREDCEVCQSKKSLKKLPSHFSTKREDSFSRPTKVGDVVKKSIENFREELELEKKSLEGLEWTPDE